MTIARNGSIGVRGLALFVGLLILNAVARAELLPLKSYTSANGLAHNEIHQIVQDSRGFLWFCTVLGLSRFDGYGFTVYGTEHGLPSKATNDLLETRDSVYWVATNGDGIYRLDYRPARTDTNQSAGTTNQTRPLFVHYPVGDEPASNRVNVLYQDRTSQVWAGTDAGLFRLDVNAEKFVRVELALPAQHERLAIWDFVEDLEGSLWIATTLGLVRRLTDGRMIHYRIQASRGRDLIHKLILDRLGRIWVGHESTGLIVFRPLPSSSTLVVAGPPWRSIRTQAVTTRDSKPRLPDQPGEASIFTTADGLGSNTLTWLLEDHKGGIWAGTPNGVAVLEGTRFRNYTTLHGLSSNRISCLKEDGDGNLWIGTATAGAMRLARNGFITYLTRDGLGHEAASTIFENRMGEMFVVSMEGYLNSIGKERITAVRPNLIRGAPNDLRYALEDHEGEWWFATVHGLYRFPRVRKIGQLATMTPKAYYTIKEGLIDNDVGRLYEDSRGDIWIGSFSAGREVLARWERATGRFHRYSDQQGLQSFHGALSFCEDRLGYLWIGFRDGPLARYRQGQFTLFTEEDGLPEGSILDLHPDNAGRLWIATRGGGVGLIEDLSSERPGVVTYTTVEGLSSNSINCIGEDDKGDMYFGTAQGIDRLDPATNQITRYALSEGVIAIPLAAHRDRRGALWFATQSGVSRFEPHHDRTNLTPTTLIGGLRIAGIAQHISELGETDISGLALSPDQSHIQIDYFGLNISQGYALRYQFKIEGVDRDWSALTDHRSVNLTLAPGSYRFLVRAVGAGGTVSPSPATVQFRILPPVWRRWWFIMVVGLLIASAVFAYARQRASQLKELRDSENRFRALAETASDAIFAIDEQGRVVFTNLAAESIFGYKTEEMMQQEISRFIPGYLRFLRLAGLGDQSAIDISWDARELLGIHRSGREVPLELSFSEFSRNDRRYITIIARDVTERKRAEEALRKSREDRLTELEQVRGRIAADLHDDIGSSLSQISLLSEVARRGAADAPQVSEPLSLISAASHEVLNSMSDIVWAINPQRDHLSDLLHRIRRFAGETLNASNIPFTFLGSELSQDLRLGANIRREVFLIFKESVNNIVRHSGCTEAAIEFGIEDDSLKLRVSDNGKGFDVARARDGHGLTSMRARAAGIGGRFELDSAPGNGTTLTLIVPLQH